MEPCNPPCRGRWAGEWAVLQFGPPPVNGDFRRGGGIRARGDDLRAMGSDRTIARIVEADDASCIRFPNDEEEIGEAAAIAPTP